MPIASSSSPSDVWSVASNLSNAPWQGVPFDRRDAGCQTDHLPFMRTLADIIEEDRLSWARAQAAAVAAPAQAAAVAAPAQAAAQSSAQPPAQRPQAGNGMNYFNILGNLMGRWSRVDGV